MPLMPSGLKKEVFRKHREIFSEMSRTITIISRPESYETVDCPNCLSSGGTSTGVYDSSFSSPTTIFGNVITPTPFTRSRCPVCLGEGFLRNEIILSKCIEALVRWNPAGNDGRETLVSTPAGFEGSDVVRVEVAKCHFSLLRDSEHVLIDGIKCTLIRPPVFRHLSDVDITVAAFLMSVEVGHSSRDI